MASSRAATSSRKDNLKRHTNSHINDGSNIQQNYNNPHNVRDSNKIVYMFNECGKEFNRKDNLNRHSKLNHVSSNKKIDNKKSQIQARYVKI